jgi:hypothetical protein
MLHLDSDDLTRITELNSPVFLRNFVFVLPVLKGKIYVTQKYNRNMLIFVMATFITSSEINSLLQHSQQGTAFTGLPITKSGDISCNYSKQNDVFFLL